MTLLDFSMLQSKPKLNAIAALMTAIVFAVFLLDLRVFAQVSSDLPKELNPYNFVLSLIGDNVSAAAIGALICAYFVYRKGGLKDQLDDNAEMISRNNRLLRAIAKKIQINPDEDLL